MGTNTSVEQSQEIAIRLLRTVLATLNDARAPKLIPAPRQITVRQGCFMRPGRISFNTLKGARGLSEATVRLALGDALDLESAPVARPPQTGLRLLIDPKGVDSDSREGYKLTVEPDRVTIAGRSVDGVLMGAKERGKRNVRTCRKVRLAAHQVKSF